MVDYSFAVQTHGLSKQFKVPVRDAGVGASVKSLFKRKFRAIDAVLDVDIEIKRGEVVGFLGPNGAGKTTTLKMLTGLLHPTSGDATVLGYTPYERDRHFLSRISLVMGQRQQLDFDIPAIDSMHMLRTFYALDRNAFDEQLDELVELLSLDELLDKPVRQLSLGEKMRCELAAGLLHRPELLLLDEPTLGLDVQAQRKVREFIGRYAERSGATVLLTSHYMADIEALCERVIVIHHGKIHYDGGLRDLTAKMSDRKLVIARFDPQHEAAHDENKSRALLEPIGKVVEVDGAEIVVALPRTEIRDQIAALLEVPGVIDFTVEDEPIERVIERVFEASEL